MAVDKKISELASGAPAQAGDEYVVARSGANYKLTLTNIAASMPPIGATTPNTGAFTTLSASSTVSGTGFTNYFASPPAIGGTAANTGAFTSLSASSGATISGGNLTFSSTAQRITGDMSNATASNRLLFQSSTTNGNTSIGIIPNGTSQYAGIDLCSSSSVTDQSRFTIRVDGANSVTQLNSTKDGTGSFLPLAFLTGGSERVRIDTSGNVGIGTASPSYKLDVSTGVAGNIARFTDGVAQTFAVKTNASSIILQNDNSGNIVFNTGAERMRIDSSGNVGIGSSSITRAFANYNQLNINGASGSTIQMQYGGNLASNIVADSNALYVQHIGAISFGIGASGTGTERMRIDSSGNVGIGGTAAAYEKISVSGTYPTSSNVSQGFVSKATIPSGATSSFVGYYSVPSTQAAAFTCTSLYHFLAGFGTKGASSAITTQYGFLAGSDLTGATSNFGFYSDIASGSNRWNFYANGTANNYFAGNTAIGGGVDANHRLTVENTGAVHGQLVIVDNTSYYDVQMWNKATSGDNKFCAFLTDGGATNRGDITYNRGAGQVAYNVTSDVRLKENIADAVDAGDKIDAMQVRQFDWKETGNHLDYGFVAQELHNVAPHAVSKPTNDDEMWSVDYSKLVPILVKELQAVRARLAALEAK